MKKQSVKRHVKKTYWYYTTFRECALCGSQDNYKVRRYDKRPKKFEDRNKFEQFACCIHF